MPPENIQCCSCKDLANVHVSFVSGGKVQTKNYCRKHAKELGLLETPAWNLAGSMQPLSAAASGGITCNVCGTSQHEFEKSGRLGCPECYETFSALLAPVLGRVQISQQHVGKIPRKAKNTKAIHNRIKYLQEQINEAVGSERYEDAATLRDQINELQDQGEKSSETN